MRSFALPVLVVALGACGGTIDDETSSTSASAGGSAGSGGAGASAGSAGTAGGGGSAGGAGSAGGGGASAGAGGAGAGAGGGGKGGSGGSAGQGGKGGSGGSAGSGGGSGSGLGGGGSAGGGGSGGAGAAGEAGAGGSAGAQGGAGGQAGAGLPPTACAGYDYCECVANQACKVVAEDCFCPCGEQPCEPQCECDCGGGKYLGCAPTSILNPGAIEGLWLIGWSGGLNHFSWVRIDLDGSITVNDGASLATNAPFLPCSGTGTWSLAQKPETIFLYTPQGCEGMPLTFAEWLGKPAWPKGALQAVRIEGKPGGPDLMGFRFAPGQCNAAMTSCTDPLGP